MDHSLHWRSHSFIYGPVSLCLCVFFCMRVAMRKTNHLNNLYFLAKFMSFLVHIPFPRWPLLFQHRKMCKRILCTESVEFEFHAEPFVCALSISRFFPRSFSKRILDTKHGDEYAHMCAVYSFANNHFIRVECRSDGECESVRT